MPFDFSHGIDSISRWNLELIDNNGIQKICPACVFTANALQAFQRQARYLLNQSLHVGSVRTQSMPTGSPFNPNFCAGHIQNIDLPKLCNLDFTREADFANGVQCSVTNYSMLSFAIVGNRNWV
ncbi:MAG: hypothetical protein LBI69_00565, partial [Puniceicoccales bacterium]|nr:hypothetical protein [Puniceicoccales bacterium]